MRLSTQQNIDSYIGRLAIAVLRPVTELAGAVLRRDHELTVRDELVWIKLLGGGSLVLAMPMLVGFRRQHPNVRMVLVTTSAVRPFAELTGAFDEYRVIDPGGPWRLLRSAVAALWRSMRADCVIDLEVHSRLTTVFATLTTARNRVGYWLEHIFWRRGLASHLVFFNRSSGSFYFYDRVAELFDVAVADRAECRAALMAASDVRDEVADPSRVCIGFACSELGRERMLTPAQWVEVFRTNLRPTHTTFCLLGGPGDRPSAAELIATLQAEFPKLTFRNCCGEMTIRQSVAELFASAEFWGIDSSLLHLARIAGLRCVSYWGPTDPATRLRPTWNLDETMHYRKIACSPCVHTSETPPCHGDNRCIRGLFDAAPDAAPLGWTPVALPPRRSARA